MNQARFKLKKIYYITFIDDVLYVSNSYLLSVIIIVYLKLLAFRNSILHGPGVDSTMELMGVNWPL